MRNDRSVAGVVIGPHAVRFAIACAVLVVLSICVVLGQTRGTRRVSARPAAPEGPVGEEEVSRVTEITLLRTPCFSVNGCPTGKVALRSDGTASYWDFGHADPPGDWQGRVSVGDFRRLARHLIEVKFFDMMPAYRSLVSDSNEVTTTARRAGKTTRVVRSGGGPPGLSEIEAEIVDLSNGIDWRRTDGKPVPGRPGDFWPGQ